MYIFNHLQKCITKIFLHVTNGFHALTARLSIARPCSKHCFVDSCKLKWTTVQQWMFDKPGLYATPYSTWHLNAAISQNYAICQKIRLLKFCTIWYVLRSYVEIGICKKLNYCMRTILAMMGLVYFVSQHSTQNIII